MSIDESDILAALLDGYKATYVVANKLRRQGKYRLVRTDTVLRTLKRMEGRGQVKRITDARNPYAKQYMWEAAKP